MRRSIRPAHTYFLARLPHVARFYGHVPSFSIVFSTRLGKRARSTVLSCLYQVSKNQRTVPPRRQKAADPPPGNLLFTYPNDTHAHTHTTTSTFTISRVALYPPKILRGFNERRVSREKRTRSGDIPLGTSFSLGNT